MQQARPKYQRQLFEEPRAARAVQFPGDVQAQLRQALVQWLRAVAKRMREEDSNEHDHR
jgi:hypothetical protein